MATAALALRNTTRRKKNIPLQDSNKASNVKIYAQGTVSYRIVENKINNDFIHFHSDPSTKSTIFVTDEWMKGERFFFCLLIS